MESAPQQRPVATSVLIGGGVAGAVVGLAAGASAGYLLAGGSRICGDDPCGWGGAIVGGIIGEIAGLPLGVHLANRSRGSFVEPLVGSAAVAIAGIFILSRIDVPEGALPLVAIGLPAAQLAAAIGLVRKAE